MFLRSHHLSPVPYPTSLVEEIDSILDFYRKIANNDPNLLRLIIPSEEVWRFFVDGVQQANGSWAAFEYREPGYLPALYRAYQTLFDFSVNIDIHYIFRLHALATSGVDNTNYSQDDRAITGSFRDNERGVFFRLGIWKNQPNVSEDGLYEYFERNSLLTTITMNIAGISIVVDDSLLTFLRNGMEAVQSGMTNMDIVNALWRSIEVFIPKEVFKSRLALAKARLAPLLKLLGETKNNREVATGIYSTMIKNRFIRDGIEFRLASDQPIDTFSILAVEMKKLINDYQQGINQAKTSLEKLHVIATFIQSCEQLHPFLDANCRTFCMLLANHLLMRHGFLPAIFDDPNRFDAFSRHELVAEMINGMKNTVELIKKGMLYGVKTMDTFMRRDRDYFYNVVAIEEQGRDRPCKRIKY